MSLSDFPSPCVDVVLLWIHVADPTAIIGVAGHGISRVPCKVFPYMLGVSDRAEPGDVSR